jgi:hypothetical protein
MRNPLEVDHIDPRWDESREYQLVCGLENDYNYCERYNTLNIQKSNRFLPWRVAKDEIGEEPIEPGDLCQFLNRETGEWVLQEFLGEWWFKQTKDLCGNSRGGVVNKEKKLGMFNPDIQDYLKVCRKRTGRQLKENQVGIFNPDNWQKVLAGSAKENARRMKAIVVIDPQGKKHYHDSLNGAARAHHLSAGNLCGVLNGTRAHTKHFTAYYA